VGKMFGLRWGYYRGILAGMRGVAAARRGQHRWGS